MRFEAVEKCAEGCNFRCHSYVALLIPRGGVFKPRALNRGPTSAQCCAIVVHYGTALRRRCTNFHAISADQMVHSDSRHDTRQTT